MKLIEAFPLPTTYINSYVWAALNLIDDTLQSNYGTIMPIFPLADARGGDAGWDNKPYIIYENLMRFRPKPFYPIHKLQTFYFIRADASDTLVWSNAIIHILDRGDAAAQDINNYLSLNHPTAGIYFHHLKVFQVDTPSDERLDLSLRQQYTTSLIIEYEYHISKDQGFN